MQEEPYCKDEEKLSKIRARELWDKRIIDTFEVGTVNGLQQIHTYLFQDVFSFAGQIRTVNLAKGNFRFAPILFLTDNLKIIDTMPIETFDDIVEKYVEINIAHPFREGNGRSMRIWLDLLLKTRIGQCIDWSKVDKYQYLSAMERSPVNSLELRMLLRDVYMRGIQSSYQYEDLNRYDIYRL